MNSITDLRNDLLETYAMLKAKTIDLKDAAERNNTAGKIFQSLKVELSYADMRKEIPNIPFLNNREATRNDEGIYTDIVD